MNSCTGIIRGMTSYSDTAAVLAGRAAQPARKRVRREPVDKTPSNLRSLRTGSQMQEIVGQFTNLILDGELKRGELLPPERDLAVQLGVSRTVVREATKSLQSEGLVAIRHGVGIVVTGANSEPVQRVFNHALHGEADALPKLYEVRMAIELETVALAAQRRTEADLDKLRALCEEMDARAGKPRQHDKLVELDMAYHSAIAAATQNNVFIIVLEAATTLLLPERRASKRIGVSLQETQRMHWRIYEAIESGDAGLAQRLMKEHLKSPQ